MSNEMARRRNTNRSPFFNPLELMFLPFGAPTRPRNMAMPLAMNVEQKDDCYIVDFEAPGVDKDALNLTLDQGVLTVSYKQSQEINEEKEHYVYRERRMGSASRSLRLGDDVDQDAIDANYIDGVLHIVIPRKKENTAKTISIGGETESNTEETEEKVDA